MKSVHGGKVLVAMSGGVDSSVTAGLLVEQGYEVVGCFMRLGSDDSVEAAEGSACDVPTAKPGHQGCCSLNDASDARMVAAMLDIPLYVLNFKKDFGRVINYFVDEYRAGRTPNPCIRCNDWLKFGKLADYARTIDAQYIATGHYARVDRSSEGQSAPRLLRGRDERKDQSYFLFGTPPSRLRHMLMPIGDIEKSEVRRIAQQMGLPVYDKPDSQEICFVPSNDYAAMMEQHVPEMAQEGDLLDAAGRVVGTHGGQHRFTIGQRRGVGIALGYPLYVVDKDADTNTVTVGSADDLLASGLQADQTNWLIDAPGGQPIRCEVKIRHNAPAVAATVCVTKPGTLDVRFDSPQRAVAPGQAAVCYWGDELIGGGWITRALPCD